MCFTFSLDRAYAICDRINVKMGIGTCVVQPINQKYFWILNYRRLGAKRIET